MVFTKVEGFPLHGTIKSFEMIESRAGAPGIRGIITSSDNLDCVFDTQSMADRNWRSIAQDERVTFTLAEFNRPDGTKGRRADNVRRLIRLLNWAYIPFPQALYDLHEILLGEDWTFAGTPADPQYPYPILRNYLTWTFFRLQREGKVREATTIDGDVIASFNTGLVDRSYQQIYAMFRKNKNPGYQPWRYGTFCISGEPPAGKDLVRYFKPLPEPAHYFAKIGDLLYDIDAGHPEVHWEHVILDNIERLPQEFLQANCPPGFRLCNPALLPEVDRKKYLRSFAAAIEQNQQTYRNMMNRLKDAVELSIKRTRWNFKTAIPMYYPTLNNMNLLLPISLVSDEKVDIALVVEKTPSGAYLGHTILSLDMAYANARLVCRPDSDWLVPSGITVVTHDDLDEAAQGIGLGETIEPQS